MVNGLQTSSSTNPLKQEHWRVGSQSAKLDEDWARASLAAKRSGAGSVEGVVIADVELSGERRHRARRLLDSAVNLQIAKTWSVHAGPCHCCYSLAEYCARHGNPAADTNVGLLHGAKVNIGSVLPTMVPSCPCCSFNCSKSRCAFGVRIPLTKETASRMTSHT